MDQQQMEDAIQFLVENQSRFHSDLELMKEAQQQTTAQIQALTENIDAMRLEMREAFDNLIVANEVTRNLAEQIGKLTVNVSQRLTKLEEKNGEAS